MMPIQKAAKVLHGLAALASQIGESQQTVSNWKARGVPSARCPSIELATAGVVTCEELRPDIRWVRILDKRWPHPKGRPLVDHSTKKAA